MPFSSEVMTQQVQERLKGLYTLTREIEDERIRGETSINNLIKAKEKMTPDEKRSSNQKLKTLVKAAITDTEREEELLRKALNKIAEIRTIQNECRIQARNAGNKETIRQGVVMKMVESTAQTLPLFVGKPGEKPPPLCGAVVADSNYIAKSGDMVAALVKVLNKEDNWILAEVASYNNSTNKYDVIDIDEDDVDKNRHVLSRRKVIPLPLMRANPETDPNALFSKGAEVLALYPQTTCFYPAVVNQLPATHLDNYEVLFEDSSYPEGYSSPLNVTQRYVIATKQRSKQS